MQNAIGVQLISEYGSKMTTGRSNLPSDRSLKLVFELWVLLGHYTPLKHVRCNPDVAPRLTSGGYEDKVDVITPINMFIPHEDKVDVIAPINILFRGGGKF